VRQRLKKELNEIMDEQIKKRKKRSPNGRKVAPQKVPPASPKNGKNMGRKASSEM